jgi:hypothetical protein
MTQQELRRLARSGAEAKLGELQREIEAIERAFPGIRAGGAGRKSSDGAPARRVLTRRGRTRKMSVAARKAVSLAQKKRWAEWRKKKGKVTAV